MSVATWRIGLVTAAAIGLAVVAVGAAVSGEPPSADTVVSLLGEELTPAPLDEATRADFEAKLEAARQRAAAEPQSADAQIWLGRRLAYLGRYREAIKVYSRALERFPADARLYRHRGHRLITTRQLAAAVADFQEAARLTRGRPDQVEPDGLPNALDIPTSTLQSNIWYHLGLALYLQGDFEAALAAYRQGMEVSTNPDMQVATSHWLYMTLRRLGRDEEARGVLTPITAEMEIIENHEYHQLLLLYKGERKSTELTHAPERGAASAATLYGVANWHLYNGRTEEAQRIFAEILLGDQWAAFGYLAAEAEVARSRQTGPSS